MQNNERLTVISTKVNNETHRRLKIIANKKGMTIYDLLQMMCDVIRRYMDDRHNLTPEMERAMAIFEHMEGWKNALNLADPTGEKEIGEATYFLYDPTGQRKGTRAIHVTKPFFRDWTQDENIQNIVERDLCLTTPGRYRRLRSLAVDLECSSIVELMDKLIDLHSNDADVAELRRIFEDAERAENNKPVAYGERTRRKPHITPDNNLFDNSHA